MLKTKDGYILRKLAREYMIVAIGAASEDFNGMIRTNETGAFFWKELENGINFEELLQKMLLRFEDLDEKTARADLQEFLDEISFAIEEK